MSYPKSLRDAFAGIIDYAGLFPPAGLDVPKAVKEYAQLRRQAQGRWLTDKFVFPIFPDAKRDQLLSAFRAQEGGEQGVSPVALLVPPLKAPQDVPLILSTLERYGLVGRDSSLSEAKLEVLSLEFAVPDGFEDESRMEWDELRVFFGRLASQDAPLPVYLEFDWRTWTLERAHAVKGLREIHPGIGVKLRTGGLTPDMVPPPSILSSVVDSLIVCQIPFKCTAGLHAALYEVSPRFGFEMHGFVNLLALTLAQMRRAKIDDCESILVAQNHTSLDRVMTQVVGPNWLESLPEARTFFQSFGSCSVLEPLESLQAHGFSFTV